MKNVYNNIKLRMSCTTPTKTTTPSNAQALKPPKPPPKPPTKSRAQNMVPTVLVLDSDTVPGFATPLRRTIPKNQKPNKKRKRKSSF